MLVAHVLKRSAGIGTGEDEGGRLEEKVADLAEALIVVIAATGFLEVSFSIDIGNDIILTSPQFEDQTVQQIQERNETLFH